ncbi:hypothetical protein SEA_NICEHOUSE_250 [Rhodococcus phage NiceHouse]|nr:hypothetical protein SEA_NICEHOUSE_250 [Rhodococcus phage NiceHouse]
MLDFRQTLRDHTPVSTNAQEIDSYHCQTCNKWMRHAEQIDHINEKLNELIEELKRYPLETPAHDWYGFKQSTGHYYCYCGFVGEADKFAEHKRVLNNA